MHVLATKITTFRLEPELLERLDRYAEALSKESPIAGLRLNRTDALRSILLRALDDFDATSAENASAKPTPKASKPKPRKA